MRGTLMLDFGALPPEVNSARMYTGPGAGPMMAAASGWDALATQLDSFAAGYSSTLADLQGQNWSGATATAMASAAAPYIAWATTVAAQAEDAATQARAAAVAYEAAFSATVPPPVVAANRIQLATLVATNFFGQNTPTIAATEAAYAEMWAQDASAMYVYAAASSAASLLTPLDQPPQTTNPAGQSGQAAAVVHALSNSTMGQSQATLSQLMSALPQQLQALGLGQTAAAADPTAAASSTPVLTAFSTLATLYGPLNPVWQTAYAVFQAGAFGTGTRLAQIQAGKLAAKGIKPAFTIGTPTTPETECVRGGVLVSVNTSDRVGNLSVPPRWTTAAPTSDPAAESVAAKTTRFRALPAWASNASTNMPAAAPTFGPISNPPDRATGNKMFRMRDRRFRMPRPPAGG